MTSERQPTGVDPRYCPTCEKTFDALELCPEDGTSLVRLRPADDPLLGTQLDGRYTIKARLGSGGMGTVYRALQHSVGREVAVKVVNPQLITDPMVVKRFLREAKLASRLSHPNAVAVLDFGQTEAGLFYLVMELLEGLTLGQVLISDGAFPPARLARVGGQICDALTGAHRLSIVHRDLKPSNVMVLHGPGDLLKVLDFGLAKSLAPDTTATTITGTGGLLGTPAYLPPEAAQGREVDARGDLYSLGVILYELACGNLPFSSDSLPTLLTMHVVNAPPPLDAQGVPPAMAKVILRLLAKDPRDRYLDAASLKDALEAAARAGGALPPRQADSWQGATAPATVPPPRRRARVVLAAGAAALAVAAAGAILLSRGGPTVPSGAIVPTPPPTPPPSPSPPPTPPPPPPIVLAPDAAVPVAPPPPPARVRPPRPRPAPSAPASAPTVDPERAPF